MEIQTAKEVGEWLTAFSEFCACLIILGPSNVLVESARVARGKISPLSELTASKFDAVVFPGGFGAAKNL